MTRLSLYLLGAPHAECDGAPLITDTRKAIALLAYLAVTGQTHTRDAIATLLWPDLDQTRARAALRRTLSSIHAGCDATWLLADRETVGLARDGSVWCDATAFQEALSERRRHGHPPDALCDRCVELLERAIALYRDDFMAGFSLRDSVSFDDWQFFQAEGYRRDFSEALEQIVQAQIVRRAWQPAIAHARRWVALDSLHEPAHRQLMLLYAWSGERTAALRQYQVCTDVLLRELDVPPLPETTALMQAIKEQREPPPPAAAAPSSRPAPPRAAPAPPAPPPEPPRGMPLVGRADDLRRLHESHQAARSGGWLVVLEGEAGIGKTRLAEAFLVEAAACGTQSVTARCYEGEQDLAYAPFVQALRAALALPHAADALRSIDPYRLAELRRLVPEVEGRSIAPEASAEPGDAGAAGGATAGTATGAKARLFESVAQILYTLLDGPHPGVLFVDDIQWADNASLDLFAYLAHRLSAYPLYLLVTQRSFEPGQDEQLRTLLADAQRRHRATLFTPKRLDAAAVRDLVLALQPALADSASAPASAPAPASKAAGEANGEPLGPAALTALAKRLHREAEGLPFFVVEYLEALAADGLQPGGHWPQPESIRDLLRSRLARVDETARQLLATAAVIGRSFTFDALRAASGRSEEEAVTAIEGLLARGLVRELDGSTYDFSHEQLRTVVYEGVSQTRRRLLHRRVAEVLQTQARLAGQELAPLAATLAYHYEQAGQNDEAARWHAQAGEHAYALYANQDAIRHLLKAAALGYPDAAALHLRLGDVRALLGDFAQAIDEYARALAGAPDARKPAIHHRLGRVQHSLGDYARAADEYQSALDLLPGGADAPGTGAQGAGAEGAEDGSPEQGALEPDKDAALRAQVLADAALTAYRRGRSDDAIALLRRARQQAEAADDQPALTHTHTTLSHLARYAGDSAEALVQARQGLALAEEQGNLALLTATLNAVALAHAAAGAPARALPFLERALELCIKQGDRHREAALHNNLADVHHLCGQQEEAMEHLKQAVTIFAEIGSGLGGENPEIWKLTEW